MIALVVPLRAAVTTLLAVVLSGTGLLSAAAVGRAGPGVELSLDRVTWVSQLDDAMFLPGPAWAADDVRASTIFVRNDSGTTADIAVTLTRRPPSDPARDDAVTLTAVAGTEPATTLPPDERPRVVTIDDLAPGEVAPLTVRATVGADVPPGEAVDPGHLDLRADLAGPADTAATGDEGADRVGILSAAHLELAPVFLGFALVVAIAVGWRRSRTRGRRG